MNKTLHFLTLTLFIAISISIQAQEQATIRLTEKTLMHEMRATPFPLNKSMVSDRCVSFQWPLKDNNIKDKTKLRYSLRYSTDPAFKKGTVLVETRWPFFNPEEDLTPGLWYWQYGYIINGKTEWASVQQFTVEANPEKFCPPSLKKVLSCLPQTHPRVWVAADEWDNFRKSSQSKVEYQWYTEYAEKVLKEPMQSANDINSQLADGLTNKKQREVLLLRESRRVIGKEETNVEMLICSYLLTKDKRFSTEALKRIFEIIEWDKSANVKGSFNAATILSLCSMAYDSFHNLLTDGQKQKLLQQIKKSGNSFYKGFNNRLENHIADNHVWQVTLRIFTMAAFSVYGDLPEADTWIDYCYNIWLARFPGLNQDGGWHNGDSYFMVNTRTLIEVPYLYSRLTGFNFFKDPWYQASIYYTIFQQPTFSKSGGNGSSHQNVLRPGSVRIGQLDALARLTGNTYAADFVRRTLKVEPHCLKNSLLAQPGNLAGFRLQCNRPLPEGEGLTGLPMGYVLPQTGLASFITNWDRTARSAMLSFRSSPYGSTSHALANQNAFNTFYGGLSLFYSSGHHTAFVDKHSLFCERATRAHNTILVNGMGQRIGTEGYGWIPRYYVGEKIGYVLGDASNAYGKVISPLWLQRAKEINLEYTPENGWDTNHVKTFRRHIVALGKTGLSFVYDELEADEPVTWDYLLHTVINPMTVTKGKNHVHIQATNKYGISDAYLFSSGELKTETTDQFFVPPVNWLQADNKGKFKKYPNHWHFKASSDKQRKYRFAAIISTHAKPKNENQKFPQPQIMKDGSIKIASWNIKMNVSAEGEPSFVVKSTRSDYDASVSYQGGEVTVVREDGYETTLSDKLPELEI